MIKCLSLGQLDKDDLFEIIQQLGEGCRYPFWYKKYRLIATKNYPIRLIIHNAIPNNTDKNGFFDQNLMKLFFGYQTQDDFLKSYKT